MPEWTRERLAELIHRILRDDLLEVPDDFPLPRRGAD